MVIKGNIFPVAPDIMKLNYSEDIAMVEKKRHPFNLAHFRQQFQNSNLSPGDLVCQTGCYFLEAPYQANTLESGRREKLTVNFDQFDCFTFVETVLALAGCVAFGKVSLPEFRKRLQFIRYRQGIIDGYSSRLHYFTDWLRDNEQKKILFNISRKLESSDSCKRINYMTTHHDLYSSLMDKNELEKIRLTEKKLSRRCFYVTGREKVNRLKSTIKNGDIIAFTANQDGLDVAHVGFAFSRKGIMHLLHASSKESSVIISPQSIVSYLQARRKFTGIILARPLLGKEILAKYPCRC